MPRRAAWSAWTWVWAQASAAPRNQKAEEHEQVTKVVAGTEAGDIQLARDRDGHDLVYDERMERVSPDAFVSRQALATADHRDAWPARGDGEEGPDALRDPWLYEDGDDDDDLDEADGARRARQRTG